MSYEVTTTIKEGFKTVKQDTFQRPTRQDAGALMDSLLQFLSTQDWEPVTMEDGDWTLRRGKQKIRIQVWEAI